MVLLYLLGAPCGVEIEFASKIHVKLKLKSLNFTLIPSDIIIAELSDGIAVGRAVCACFGSLAGLR